MIKRAVSGGKEIELEPNYSLLPANEDFLLLIKDLLNMVEAMEKSSFKDQEIRDRIERKIVEIDKQAL